MKAAPAPAGRAALQVAALQAVLRDPVALGELSAPSRVSLETVKTGLEASLGGAIDTLKVDILPAAGAIAADAVGIALSDMAEAIPVVGSMLSLLVKLIASLAGSGDAGDDAEWCNLFLAAFRPEPTGSLFAGGTVTPADLFAPVHKFPAPGWSYSDDPKEAPVMGVSWYASALGCALMAVTEGCPADERDLAPAFRVIGNFAHGPQIWDARVARVVEGSNRDYLKKYPGAKTRGVRPSRAKQLGALRRAMAAQWGPGLPKGAVSDGGAGLWSTYLDLLGAELRAGRLDARYLAFILEYRGQSYKNPEDQIWIPGLFGYRDTYGPPGSSDRGCASVFADQILALLTGWEHTTRPYYQTGALALEPMLVKAREVANAAALRAPLLPGPKGSGSILHAMKGPRKT